MKKYVLALVLFGYGSISFGAETYVGGVGASVCGSWSEARRGPMTSKTVIQEQMTVSWVMGFVSAMNNEYAEQFPNFTQHFKRIGSDGVTGWLDNYCRANPINSVNDAAMSLVLELIN